MSEEEGDGYLETRGITGGGDLLLRARRVFPVDRGSAGQPAIGGRAGAADLEIQNASCPNEAFRQGFTPEEASKVSGPVLVRPPDQSLKMYRYKYYPTGHNNCQQDLAKLLAERAASNATSDAPYCTGTPTAPPSTGNAFIF